MANVGTADLGKVLIATGQGRSPTFVSIGTNSGLAAHGLIVAQGNGAFTVTTPGTNGQVIIGSTGGNPNFATITSSDASITFTLGANTLDLTVSGGTTVGKTITGNSGGSISPSGGNWNTLGTGSITIAGAGSTLTTQLTGLTANSVLYGLGTATIGLLGSGTTGQVLQTNTGAAPTYSTATYPSTTTVSQILYSSSTNTVTGLATANKAVLTTGATGIPVLTALATDGQIIIGSTAGVPAAATLTAGTGITITNAGNSITIAANGSTVMETLTGNSGGAISPTAGNINTLGTGSITIAGAGSTLTTQLTGLTNHAIQIGAGTATLTQLVSGTTGQVLQTNTGADPTWSTATYPSTTTVSQILYSSATNTVTGLATANRAVITTGSTGIPVATALATDGQLIIGSTAGAPAAATLSAGTGITITNASNSITIASTNASGFPWTDVTGATQTLAVNNGYITDHTNVTYTLPASGALGDTMIIVGKLGITTIAQNANQQILMSSASSTVGVTGTVVGTNVGDCITLICITSGASTVWRAKSFVGNWTIN